MRSSGVASVQVGLVRSIGFSRCTALDTRVVCNTIGLDGMERVCGQRRSANSEDSFRARKLKFLVSKALELVSELLYQNIFSNAGSSKNLVSLEETLAFA